MNRHQNVSQNPQFLSRGIDYLGDLGAKLRDLQGFKTLAHELIQNADDVPDTTEMTFNVCDDALIVENNGVFSDCGKVEEDECPWKEEKGHRCDFHRFRYVASGDKRAEEGTTGAFGIGFIAVYQITDCPELISNGRHWILHEERPEVERIEICPGCDKCKGNNLPGTRFIFPWAMDENSELRKALRTNALTKNDIDRLYDELNNSLSPSMLFLKRLNKITLKRNGKLQRVFERLPPEDNSLILTDGNPSNDQVWHIFHGDFENEARELKMKYQGRIERRRSSKVSIAIPETNKCKGLFCVFLPTEQETSFPFHINADFFPSNDRKRINLATGYEAEWNRSAIKAAAEVLAQNLEILRDRLGHKPLWELLKSIEEVASETGNGTENSTLASFWEEISPHLQTLPIVFTTSNEWVTSKECRLLLKSEESDAIQVLEKLGIKIVSEDLRPFQALLRNKIVGVQVLNIYDIYKALSSAGFDKPLKKEEWQRILVHKDYLNQLWKEIELLRSREKKTSLNTPQGDNSICFMAIAPVTGNGLHPCNEVFKADEKTKNLFLNLQPDIPFLVDAPDFKPLQELCKDFNVKVAIETLKSLGREKIAEAWERKQFDIQNLFEWFEKNKQEIVNEPRVKKQFQDLPIFPGSGQLHTLDELVLPGDFEDPLGLADIVNLELIGNRRHFLQDVGTESLDFKTYVLRLPEYLARQEISCEKRRTIIELLAKKQGELKDDPDIHSALASTALVKCTDGKFRKPKECYFDSKLVKDCLGSSVFIAVLPEKNSSSVQSLYEWLGVTNEPRTSDLLKRVKEISNSPYEQELLNPITKIIEFLGKKYKEQQFPDELEELQNISWLPAEEKRDRWYSPKELYAVFQKYLFESQALFLNIMRKIQNDSSSFLQFLGIRTTPETKLVVNHLLHCADKELSINSEIYRVLNDRSGDKEVRALKDKKCLYVAEEYIFPKDVFWNEHPFGKYRRQIGKELYSYKKLFDVLGVHDKPDYKDAVAVLMEIAEEFGSINAKIDEETRCIVFACWKMLDDAIDRNDFDEESVKSLKDVKCIPNRQNLLTIPGWIFFENRTGLAKKFGDFLSNNVINKPVEGGRAMIKAGVRLLGSAVKIRLIEPEDENLYPDNEISDRIKERRHLFARILEPNQSGNSVKTSEILERLDGIRFQSGPTLKIQYTLNAFNQIKESEVESVSAFYQSTEKRLIFARKNGQINWPAFSRELAIALLPDQDPGKISSQVKDILSADSLAQASQTLDDLGFPEVDTTTPPQAPNTQTVTALGMDSDIPNSYSDVPQSPKSSEAFSTHPNIPSHQESTQSVDTGKPPVDVNNTVSPRTEADFNYKDELQKSFNRPGETEFQGQAIDTGKVKDPDRRREKSYEEHKKRLDHEPKPNERRKETMRTILEGPDEQVREYLSQFYDGKCQICGKTFPERNGKPFFIANYIVPKKLARFIDTPANALCLCAEHFAKWQHGAVEAEGIIGQIENFKTESESGNCKPVLKIILCGEECEIKFIEKHLLDLQELLRASEIGNDYQKLDGI